MKNVSRPTTIICLIVALLVALTAWFIWILAKGHLDLGAGHPDTEDFASVDSAAMLGSIRVTPESTWMVSQLEYENPDLSVPAAATDLATLLGEKTGDYEPVMASTVLMNRGSSTYSYISRLGDDGHFHVVAHIGARVSLRASNDGRHVYALTGMDRSDKSYSDDNPATRQSAVFRSDDQGQSWTWQREGYVAPADAAAWATDDATDAYDTIWAWETLPRRKITNGKPILTGRGSGLYYSTDGGRTSAEVEKSGPLLRTRDDIQDELPAVDAAGAPVSGFGEVATFVARLGPDRASLWISQTIPYGPARDPSFFRTTQFASLTRVGDAWRMGEIHQRPGVLIENLQQGPDGRTRAIAKLPDKHGDQVIAIDPDSLAMNVLGPLPGAFDPLDSSAYPREFRVGRHSMMVRMSSTYTVPRWVYVLGWFDDSQAHISGDAAFYSDDDGQSWHKLDTNERLGFDASGDRFFWHPGRGAEDATVIQVDHLASE